MHIYIYMCMLINIHIHTYVYIHVLIFKCICVCLCEYKCVGVVLLQRLLQAGTKTQVLWYLMQKAFWLFLSILITLCGQVMYV